MALKFRTSLVEVDSKHGLLVGSDDPATAEFFQDRGYEGNGYTWNGLVEGIARIELAGQREELDWSPEADNLLVICRDSGLLVRLEQHLTQYAGDSAKVESALTAADPEMLD